MWAPKCSGCINTVCDEKIWKLPSLGDRGDELGFPQLSAPSSLTSPSSRLLHIWKPELSSCQLLPLAPFLLYTVESGKNHKGVCLQLKLRHCLSILALVPAQQGRKREQSPHSIGSKGLYDVSLLPGGCLCSLSARVHGDWVSILTRHHKEQTWHFQFRKGGREYRPMLLYS